ncbi:hypothetical protein V6N13_140698 [Hibiscus sabdariffa]|uniref:RING-type E3 ubiquitin transferase n=1 Tax=Hibiscus sabdariffa TaxID=183260 RepID=A0ABR2Q2H9_9ROSI
MAEKVESGSAVGGKKETKVKEELESAVKTILVEDDYATDKTVEAIRILTRLTELKLKKPSSLGLDDTFLSETFKCPISGEIMGDPVVLASGQTYDRPNIEKWLKQGNITCFQSKQVLSHSFLTPNCLVREMITRWCEASGVAVPKPRQDVGGEFITERIQILLNSLLERMSSTLFEQKIAAKELRRLTQISPSNGVVFCELPGAVSRLLSPLSESKVESHPDLQENLITTLLNISSHELNKRKVAENPVVLPLLIESMRYGTIETRKNAAAAILALSTLDSNKVIIGKSGAPGALLEVLHGGHPLAMKEAASAIMSLCMTNEIRTQLIHMDLAKVIMHKIYDSILVEELLGILVQICTHPIAAFQLREIRTVHCLIGVIRNSNCCLTKENCAVILSTVCKGTRSLLKELWVIEGQQKTLAELADTGTEVAKQMATGLITSISATFPTSRGD